MKKTKLSQELYDNLCLSLGRNAKALNNDPGFSTLKRKLESSASTSLNGVEVSSAYLDLAVEALTHNVKVNGGKYASSLDKLVLLEIDDALNAPPSRDTETEGLPAPNAGAASTTPLPLHDSRQQGSTQVSNTPRGGLFVHRWVGEGIDGLIRDDYTKAE